MLVPTNLARKSAHKSGDAHGRERFSNPCLGINWKMMQQPTTFGACEYSRRKRTRDRMPPMGKPRLDGASTWRHHGGGEPECLDCWSACARPSRVPPNIPTTLYGIPAHISTSKPPFFRVDPQGSCVYPLAAATSLAMVYENFWSALRKLIPYQTEQELASVAHPYYPLYRPIPNYAANSLEMPELLTIFAIGCTVLLSITWFILGKTSARTHGWDKATILWFTLSRLGTFNVCEQS